MKRIIFAMNMKFYVIFFSLIICCSTALAGYSICPELKGYAICQNGTWQLILQNKPDEWPINAYTAGSCTQEGERVNNVLFKAAFYANATMNCYYDVMGNIYQGTDVEFSLKSMDYIYITNSEISPSLWQKNYSSSIWLCPIDGSGISSPVLCPIKSVS